MKTSIIFLFLLSILALVAAGPIRSSSDGTTRTPHPLTNTRLHTIPSLTYLTGTHTAILVQITPTTTLQARGEPHFADPEACLEDCDDTCMYYGLCSDEQWDRHLSELGASHTAWLNSVLSGPSAEMREQATKFKEAKVVAMPTRVDSREEDLMMMERFESMWSRGPESWSVLHADKMPATKTKGV